MNVYNIYKKIGETPLEALEKLRKARKISRAAKLTYIGRLDPMASGVLLILQDATQGDREKYMGLDKEYRVEALFGISTDTHDLLGLPVIPSEQHRKGLSRVEGSLNADKIKKLLLSYEGKIKLPVPAYSSIPYKGKPMFEWARSGKLKTKDIPKREMEIKKIKFLKLTSLSSDKLRSYIEKNIAKVKGDFRQEKILAAWDSLLCHPGIFAQSKSLASKNVRDLALRKDSGHSGKEMLKRNSGMTQSQFLISNFLISVSSGTYIRSIAHDLGKKLKTGAVVFSLERTRVGKYKKSLS